MQVDNADVSQLLTKVSPSVFFRCAFSACEVIGDDSHGRMGPNRRAAGLTRGEWSPELIENRQGDEGRPGAGQHVGTHVSAMGRV